MSFFESLVPLFGIVFTFGIPGLIIFWLIYTKHRERMRIIEKGFTPEEAKKFFNESEKKPRNRFSALKWGIILLFLGAGIFLSNILSQFYDFGDGILIGLVILFLGAGYLIYYLIISRTLKNNPDTKLASEKN
jgi:di/tricarboxylate transporter